MLTDLKSGAPGLGRDGQLPNPLQKGSDYHRGYQAALADAKGGWARCWLPARQLAEDAVYGTYGLTEKQMGYSDGLDECFPGGVSQAPTYLAKPLPPFAFVYCPSQGSPPVAVPVPDEPAPGEAPPAPPGGCPPPRVAPGLGMAGSVKKELTAAVRQSIRAQLV